MPKKSCNSFCKDHYMPAREEIEKLVAAEMKTRYIYLDNHPNKEYAQIMKKVYMDLCKKVYCNPGCDGKKIDFLPSVTEKRKATLKSKGAKTVCRDFTKEYPKYYKSEKF